MAVKNIACTVPRPTALYLDGLPSASTIATEVLPRLRWDWNCDLIMFHALGKLTLFVIFDQARRGKNPHVSHPVLGVSDQILNKEVLSLFTLTAIGGFEPIPE